MNKSPENQSLIRDANIFFLLDFGEKKNQFTHDKDLPFDCLEFKLLLIGLCLIKLQNVSTCAEWLSHQIDKKINESPTQ